MATIKDVEKVVEHLDVKVKIVYGLENGEKMKITRDGVIYIDRDFLEKLSMTELEFAINHEYAHIELNHFHRLGQGESQLTLEAEADKYAANKLKAKGQKLCGELDDIEALRPLWDTTHPSRSSLRGLTCDDQPIATNWSENGNKS